MIHKSLLRWFIHFEHLKGVFCTTQVTAIDMMCWVSVHVHIMEGWERLPHLLHISYISELGIDNHLTERIMLALMREGSLTREEIACKLVCFGADGVSTFQGHKTSVTTQIREKYAPFSIGIWAIFRSGYLIPDERNTGKDANHFLPTLANPTAYVTLIPFGA